MNDHHIPRAEDLVPGNFFYCAPRWVLVISVDATEPDRMFIMVLSDASNGYLLVHHHGSVPGWWNALEPL